MIVYDLRLRQAVPGAFAIAAPFHPAPGRPALWGSAGDMAPLRPATLVDQVIDALVAAAARGAILPGDRIVESEVAARLGVSRVPVREALRLLESQGLALSEPYKGIRLRPVTNARVDALIEARVALEASATAGAVRAKRHAPPHLAALEAAVREMDLMAARGDASGLAEADTAFHRALVTLGGNAVTSELWETLARQFTIIFGLATLGKPMPAIVDEHRDLLAVFAGGRPAAIRRALDEHITVMNHAVDYEAIIARRRDERDGIKPFEDLAL